MSKVIQSQVDSSSSVKINLESTGEEFWSSFFGVQKKHVCPNNMGTLILCVPAPKNDLHRFVFKSEDYHFGIFRMKYQPVFSEWEAADVCQQPL